MSNAEQQPQPESWARKLNKALIAVGIIAFGLVVTDRVLEAFRADTPATDIATLQPMPAEEIAQVSDVTVAQPESLLDALPTSTDGTGDGDGQEKLLELESLLGSKVVFVSAAEPAYLITANEKRYEVGSPVDDQTMLAGVTTQQIFFEQAGDLIVISLPEPVVQ